VVPPAVRRARPRRVPARSRAPRRVRRQLAATSTLSLADHARQCCRLLDKLGIRRAHWIGHSSSACIGLQAALDVIGPTTAAVGAGDFAQATDTFLRGIDGPAYRDVVTARLGEDAFDRVLRDAVFFFTDEVPAAVEWDLDAGLASQITVPTLIVTGGRSAAVTRVDDETAAILAGMLPTARHVVLPGVSHSMPLQDPAALARLIAGSMPE
jgi:pimeloyl-ACP methyl ester carboxylesterase